MARYQLDDCIDFVEVVVIDIGHRKMIQRSCEVVTEAP